MDSTGVLQLLEQLDDEIDGLEDALSPLLNNALSATASKLPVLDKAKLYVVMTYAIESILFSYLRINGVKAREHPVFQELMRVRQYFDKIKTAETPVAKRENMSLDKPAAGRILKAALSGNDKYDLERAERIAKERACAQLKYEALTRKEEATRTHIRFNEPGEEEEDKNSPVNVNDDTSSNSNSDSIASSALESKINVASAKKRKVDALSVNRPDSMIDHAKGFDGGAGIPSAKRKKGNGLKSKKLKEKEKGNE